MVPDFLSVGFIVRDFVEGHEQPGGSALYAAKTAFTLGLDAAIWTSAEADFPPESFFPSARIARGSSRSTTTFLHHYDPVTRERTSVCERLADPLDPNALPENWRKSRHVFLAPNWDEVTPETVSLFDTQWLALAPQGWFRMKQSDGSFRFGKSKWAALPRKAALIVVSEQDVIGDPEAWDWIRDSAVVAVRTHGSRGHLVSWKGVERLLIPPFTATEVDPTGAGDVFATGMLIALSGGLNPFEAATFGSAAASYVVERQGMDGVPTRDQVLKRIKPL